MVNYVQWQSREQLRLAHKSPDFRKEWDRFDRLERFPLRWNRARAIVACPISPQARFHLSGNARTDVARLNEAHSA